MCGLLIPLFSSASPAVGQQDPMIDLLFLCEATLYCSCKDCTACQPRLYCLRISLQNIVRTCYCLFDYSFSTRLRQYISVVLIYISLMADNTNDFPCTVFVSQVYFFPSSSSLLLLFHLLLLHLTLLLFLPPVCLLVLLLLGLMLLLLLLFVLLFLLIFFYLIYNTLSVNFLTEIWYLILTT